MLVSAAMAERPRATAAGRTQAPPSAQPPAGRHSTARVAPLEGGRRTELPGWFWGALGCLTVLVVGLSIVFLVGQPGVAPPAAAATVHAVEPAPAAAAPQAAPPVPAAAADPKVTAPAMKIEPMAAPAAAVAPAAPQPKPHASSRPIKVARSPSAAKAASGSKATAGASDDSGDDEPKAKAKAAAPADDSDDEPRGKRTSAEDEALDR